MIETNPLKRDRSFFFVCVLFLASRLLLLNYNQAELLDGYAFIKWTFTFSWKDGLQVISKHLPAYPLLIKLPALFLDPVLSGRLISTLGGFFCLFPLYVLGLEIYGRRTAILVCLLFTVSAQILFLTTRVLSEPVFLAFSLAAIQKAFRFFSDQDIESLPWLVLFSGLAALTRPEGLFFVPLCLFALFLAFRRGKRKPLLLCIVPGLLWFVDFWLIHQSGSGYGSEMLRGFHSSTAWRFGYHLWTLVGIYPYVIFGPLFVFAIYNQFRGSTQKRRIWLLLFAYVHLTLLTVFCVHWAWTTRFLALPISLLLTEAAAGMVRFENGQSGRLKKGINVACVFGSIVFAAVTLHYQKDTCADIKQAAQYIGIHLPDARIFSNDAFKVAFYTNRDVKPYSSTELYRRSDIIALSSFYGDIEEQKKLLKVRYFIEEIFRTDSFVIPMLGNTIVAKGKGTNTPRVLQCLFQTQKFTSVVLQIGRRTRTRVKGTVRQ